MTLGDADFRKSLMKMIYRKLSKTASLPVTCHPHPSTNSDGSMNRAQRGLVLQFENFFLFQTNQTCIFQIQPYIWSTLANYGKHITSRLRAGDVP
jgi:hypothetical protein